MMELLRCNPRDSKSISIKNSSILFRTGELSALKSCFLIISRRSPSNSNVLLLSSKINDLFWRVSGMFVIIRKFFHLSDITILSNWNWLFFSRLKINKRHHYTRINGASQIFGSLFDKCEAYIFMFSIASFVLSISLETLLCFCLYVYYYV